MTMQPQRRTIALAALAAVFLVAGAAAAAWWWLDGRWHEATDDAYAQGNLVQLTPQIGGIVVRINADDTALVRAGELSLGSVMTSQPIASFSEAKHGAFSDSNYDGNVGSGLLKRYVATFDYSRRTLYLKPAQNLDPDVGAFDRVGMWINLGGGDMVVMDLAADGPAAQAGLKVGDVITAIDGAAVSTRPLSDVRRSLKTAPIGRPFAIAYSRAGTSAIAQVVPRDLIPPMRSDARANDSVRYLLDAGTIAGVYYRGVCVPKT